MAVPDGLEAALRRAGEAEEEEAEAAAVCR